MSDVTPGIYQHYKGPFYTVLFTAYESSSGRDREPLIIYVSHKQGSINSRREEDFTKMVTWPDGKERRRFIRADKETETQDEEPVLEGDYALVIRPPHPRSPRRTADLWIWTDKWVTLVENIELPQSAEVGDSINLETTGLEETTLSELAHNVFPLEDKLPPAPTVAT